MDTLTRKEKTERLVVARTKRALERQLMRGGCPRREAERIVSRMSQRERLKRLSLWQVAKIAFLRSV